MKIHPLTYRLTGALLVALALSPSPVFSQDRSVSEVEATRAQHEAMLEQAEKARLDAVEKSVEAREIAHSHAEVARVEAESKREVLSQQQALQNQETKRMREELSRTHRQLREASREVARAHRELSQLAQQKVQIRHVNLGDRAVIGAILGPATAEGIQIIGVSPDGPAERAGLRQSDVLTTVEGVDLLGHGDESARQAMDRIMEEVSAGDELDIRLIRDGKVLSFTVTAEQREPRSWQSLIRIPEVDGVDQVVIKQIRVPEVEIDEDALDAEIAALEEKVEEMEYVFITSGDELDDHTGEWEIEFEEMSQFGEHALREANVWFGLPHAEGFELTAINPGLGEYFETERGVLVIKARADNAYNLLSGDVVLEIDSTEVDSPADMMRALRELDSGNEIEIIIKRDRRDVSLRVIVPENRFGLNTIMPHGW